MKMNCISTLGRTTPGNYSFIFLKPVLYTLLQNVFSELIIMAMPAAEMKQQNLSSIRLLAREVPLVYTSLGICLKAFIVLIERFYGRRGQ